MHPQTLSYHQTCHYWMSPQLLRETNKKKVDFCFLTLMFSFSSSHHRPYKDHTHTHTHIHCITAYLIWSSSWVQSVQSDAIPVYSAFALNCAVSPILYIHSSVCEHAHRNICVPLHSQISPFPHMRHNNNTHKRRQWSSKDLPWQLLLMNVNCKTSGELLDYQC